MASKSREAAWSAWWNRFVWPPSGEGMQDQLVLWPNFVDWESERSCGGHTVSLSQGKKPESILWGLEGGSVELGGRPVLPSWGLSLRMPPSSCKMLANSPNVSNILLVLAMLFRGGGHEPKPPSVCFIKLERTCCSKAKVSCDFKGRVRTLRSAFCLLCHCKIKSRFFFFFFLSFFFLGGRRVVVGNRGCHCSYSLADLIISQEFRNGKGLAESHTAESRLNPVS